MELNRLSSHLGDLFRKTKNVLNPDKIKAAFDKTYQKVAAGPISKVAQADVFSRMGRVLINENGHVVFSGKGKVSQGERVDVGSKGTEKDIQIPSVRNKEFNKWFDNLSVNKFEEMWIDPHLRSKIEDRIRRPGGYHEWHLVARTPKFKQWGVSMDDIKEMRTLTKDVEFVNPPGRHGRRGSTKAHNEILKIIDSAPDYESFVRELNE
ncbi:hypothetical protein [Bacillus sp. P14.5]|uniref:hypothetical protein n=1 Tax=Bacillus sp. P14.5 TaxID=1983400 RepID=UPI000DEA1D6A|nr:hypothetical protein [Bacillus sp. P14.5]